MFEGLSLKICFIAFEYPTNKACGAGVYAWNLTKSLAELGHEVHVITWGSFFTKEVKNLHVHKALKSKNFLSLPPFCHQLLYIISLPLQMIRINKISRKIEIIHVNSQFYSALVCFFSLQIIPFLRKVPKVLTVHHLWFDEYLARDQPLPKTKIELNLSTFSLAMEPIIVKRATAIITVSNFTRQALNKVYGFSKNKIFVVPNGVIRPLPVTIKTIYKKNGEIWLLSIGQLEPRKGINVLLNAFTALSIKFPTVHLILVGKGLFNKSHKPMIQIPPKVAQRVHIYDYVDYAQLSELYDACDIYVSASLLEGFGLTVLEAMSIGKPVIATQCGGIPEFVKSGVNGILVSPNDCQALYDAISYMLEQKSGWQGIGTINEEYVRSHFSWVTAAMKT